MKDFREKALKGTAKLHGLIGGQKDGVTVDTREGVIDDGLGPTSMLRDDTKGAKPQVLQLCHQCHWKEGSVCFVEHGGEFLAQELLMVHHGSVGSPVQSGVLLCQGPGRCFHGDRRPCPSQVVQDVCGWMWERADVI